MLYPSPHQETFKNPTLPRLIAPFTPRIVEGLQVPPLHVVPVSTHPGDNTALNHLDQTRETTHLQPHLLTSNHIPVDAGPTVAHGESPMKTQTTAVSLEEVTLLLRCLRVWTLLLVWSQICLN